MTVSSKSMILAAPIQGFTDRFWRKAHFSVIGGITEYVTPFLRMEKGCIRKKDLADLPADEPNTVPQILVKTPGELQYFANILGEKGFSRIDLNFGCPYEPVVRRGYGAGILRSPDVVEAIFRETAKIPEITFSVKMRLPDSPEILSVLNSFHLRHIVLHPRTAKQQYAGMPNCEAFENFAAKSINPVIYNGDIRSAADVKYPAVMIGRGLLYDPLLGRRFRGENPAKDLLISFHESYLRNCMELEQPLQKLKTLWEYFLPDTSGKLRKKILRSRTHEEYSDSVRQLFIELEQVESYTADNIPLK